jgi:hypothetical protein
MLWNPTIHGVGEPLWVGNCEYGSGIAMKAVKSGPASICEGIVVDVSP